MSLNKELSDLYNHRLILGDLRLDRYLW